MHHACTKKLLYGQVTKFSLFSVILIQKNSLLDFFLLMLVMLDFVFFILRDARYFFRICASPHQKSNGPSLIVHKLKGVVIRGGGTGGLGGYSPPRSKSGGLQFIIYNLAPQRKIRSATPDSDFLQ